MTLWLGCLCGANETGDKFTIIQLIWTSLNTTDGMRIGVLKSCIKSINNAFMGQGQSGSETNKIFHKSLNVGK